MTDIMSEQFGRELVARTSFEKEAIWMPLLAVHQLNANEPIIRGKTFTDCLIEGASLVAILEGNAFDGCNMGVVSDPRSLFFKPQGPIAVGAVGLADCKFVRCTFRQVGFIANDEFMQTMIDSMEAASNGGAA
jgi:hypothetical protein